MSVTGQPPCSKAITHNSAISAAPPGVWQASSVKGEDVRKAVMRASGCVRFPGLKAAPGKGPARPILAPGHP